MNAATPPQQLAAEQTAALLLAGLCLMSGVLHVGVLAGDLQQASRDTALVAMIAAFQIGWAGLMLRHPSYPALAWVASASAAFASLWLLSRTVGVPFGPEPWVAEPIGVVDAIAAGAEVVIVLAAGCILLADRRRLAARALPNMPPVLLGVMFISILYGVAGGAHAGSSSIWLCC